MFNHNDDFNVDWAYDEDREGFKVVAVKDISQGEQLFDTYGQRTSYAFFMYYGIVN